MELQSVAGGERSGGWVGGGERGAWSVLVLWVCVYAACRAVIGWGGGHSFKMLMLNDTLIGNVLRRNIQELQLVKSCNKLQKHINIFV